MSGSLKTTFPVVSVTSGSSIEPWGLGQARKQSLWFGGVLAFFETQIYVS